MNDDNGKREIIPYDGSTGLAKSTAGLNHAWRLAQTFANSQLVPAHLQGKPHDCMLALFMAEEMHENPLVVMQSIYIVKGKAGWAAQYVIARANRSGVFRGRINWREEGEGDSLIVTAYATLDATGEEVEFPASMAMAKAEGWTSNPKYRSMPRLMLRYRSAVFLVRLYAPEIMLGYQAAEEIETTVTAEVADAPRLADVLSGAPTLEQQAADVAAERPVEATEIVPDNEALSRADLASECLALGAELGEELTGEIVDAMALEWPPSGKWRRATLEELRAEMAAAARVGG